MQHRDIVGVIEGTQQGALLLVRIGQQLERLVGMRRHHDIGEPLAMASWYRSP